MTSATERRTRVLAAHASLGDLVDLAESEQLAGWQALFYAAPNAQLHQQHPHPWPLAEDIQLVVDLSFDEQRAALNARMAEIERRQNACQPVFTQQTSLLAAPIASDALADPDRALGPLIHALTQSHLQAISLLKAVDTSRTRADFVLAEDALQRRQPLPSTQCSMLISLLARAAQGVLWAIPTPAAQGWCDPACPHHWAKSLFLPRPTHARPNSTSPAARLHQLKTAHRVAQTQVQQQLGALRTDAMMELNRLVRDQDAA